MLPQHVPAWKRLGLKLKYANDINGHVATISPSQKRVADEFESDAGPIPESVQSPKRSRTEEPTQLASTSIGDKTIILSPSLRRPNGNALLKKKVSFTAETKQLDGDSSKSLLAAWDANNYSDSHDFAHYQSFHNHQAQYEPTGPPRASDAVSPSNVQMKRPKEKRKGNTKTIAIPRKSKDALEYLEQHHEAKGSWKFNKNREVWIFKHILSIREIPASYDTALADYIGGLQSEAARTRLADQCLKAICDDLEAHAKTADAGTSDANRRAMENLARRKEYYQDRVERFDRSAQAGSDKTKAIETAPQDVYEKLAALGRAILLLDTLRPEDQYKNGATKISNVAVSDRQSSMNGSNANNQTGSPAKTPPNSKARKRRKARTAVIAVSDTSSGSEEPSSSDDKAFTTQPLAFPRSSKTSYTTDDTTSTSGSDTATQNEPEASTSSSDELLSDSASSLAKKRIRLKINLASTSTQAARNKATESNRVSSGSEESSSEDSSTEK